MIQFVRGHYVNVVVLCDISFSIFFLHHQSHRSRLSLNVRTTLSGLVKTNSHDMRINHRHVEWRNEEVGISKENGHGTVDDTVIAVDEPLWLEGVAGVVTSCDQWRVCEIQLLTPCHECGSTSRGRCNVGVVGADSLTGGVPLKENLLAGEAERLRLVVGDAWSAAVASNVQILTASGDIGDRWVGDTRANLLAAVLSSVIGRVAVDVAIVQDVEGREVLPRPINDQISIRVHKRCRSGSPLQPSLILWAVADILRKHTPSPRLGPAVLEPYIHWGKTTHLAEDHLLTCLSGN